MPNLDLSIAKIMHGSTPVLKIMQGDTKVWPDGDIAIVDCAFTNVTSSITLPARVNLNESFTVTLTPNTSCIINEISVTMGGVDVTSTVYNAGVITIASVTGDVVVTASAIEVITFEDANVKQICVENWGGNVIQGEITPAEAAAVTTVRGFFNNNTTIVKFNEFVYFTNAKGSWDNIFAGCTALEEITAPPVNVTNFGYAFRYCRKLRYCDLSRITTSWSTDIRAFEEAAYNQSSMELKVGEFLFTSNANFSYCGSKTVPIDVTQGYISFQKGHPSSKNMFRRFRRALIKNIGTKDTTCYMHGCKDWGLNTDTHTDNLDLMKQSLLTYSVDRRALNKADISLVLHPNAAARLSDEEKAAIAARGYVISTST